MEDKDMITLLPRVAAAIVVAVNAVRSQERNNVEGWLLASSIFYIVEHLWDLAHPSCTLKLPHFSLQTYSVIFLCWKHMGVLSQCPLPSENVPSSLLPTAALLSSHNKIFHPTMYHIHLSTPLWVHLFRFQTCTKSLLTKTYVYTSITPYLTKTIFSFNKVHMAEPLIVKALQHHYLFSEWVNTFKFSVFAPSLLPHIWSLSVHRKQFV